MPQKRTDRRPADYVRCHMCGRLSLKVTTTKFNGVFYGQSCLRRAINATNNDPVMAALRAVVSETAEGEDKSDNQEHGPG